MINLLRPCSVPILIRRWIEINLLELSRTKPKIFHFINKTHTHPLLWAFFVARRIFREHFWARFYWKKYRTECGGVKSNSQGRFQMSWLPFCVMSSAFAYFLRHHLMYWLSMKAINTYDTYLPRSKLRVGVVQYGKCGHKTFYLLVASSFRIICVVVVAFLLYGHKYFVNSCSVTVTIKPLVDDVCWIIKIDFMLY